MTKMQELGVQSNPFDVIFQTAVEIARAVNRLAIRYNNPDLPIVSMDETCLDNYMTRIQENFALLSQMSPEDLQVCRKTSYNYQGTNESQINDLFFKLYQDIPTVYSKSNPRYPLEFERAFYGENSEEYRRRRLLDKWLETDFAGIDRDIFSNIADYLEHGMDFCRQQWNWSDAKAEEVGRLQYDYELTEDDINYILDNR